MHFDVSSQLVGIGVDRQSYVVRSILPRSESGQSLSLSHPPKELEPLLKQKGETPCRRRSTSSSQLCSSSVR